MNMPSKKKVAQAIRASVDSGVVLVQSFPDRAALKTVTAASIASNKAAYSCGHCHTKIVASAGAAPACVVCGTETKKIQASVEIDAPKDMSCMTAVECKSCGSVSVMEKNVLTASAHHVHCSVCGAENNYAKAATNVTAAKLKFLQEDGEKWGDYNGSGSFSFEQGRMLAMEHGGSAGLLHDASGKVQLVQVPKKVQYLNSKGEVGSKPETIARKIAVKLAQSHGGNVALVPESPTHFQVAVLPEDATASLKVTAAAKLKKFWNPGTGEYDATYSNAKPIAIAKAKAALAADANAIAVPQPDGTLLVALSPVSISKMKKVGADGNVSAKPRLLKSIKPAIDLAQSYSGDGHAVIYSEIADETETVFGVAVFKGTVEASVHVTAAKMKFLQEDGNKWGDYHGSGSFSFEKGRMLAMEHDGKVGLLHDASGQVLLIQMPKKVQYLNSKGETVSKPETIARKIAVKLAQSHGGNVALVPESPTHFQVAVLPDDATAAFKTVAASNKMQEFLGPNGDWTTYSEAKAYAPGFARSLVVEHEDAVMLPEPSGRVLIAKIPGGYSKLKAVDASGTPVALEGAPTFKLSAALKMAQNVTDGKSVGVLVPVGFTDFNVVLYKGGVVNASADNDEDEDDSAAEAGGKWPFELTDVESSASDSEATETLHEEMEEPQVHKASDDGDADDEVGAAGSSGWPFVKASDDEDADDSVEAADDVEEDSDEPIVFKDDDLELASDDMPETADMDNLDVELEDLDEPADAFSDEAGDLDEMANAEEMPPVENAGHSSFDVPSTPGDMSMAPPVAYEGGEAKINEVTDGETLADALDIDDSDAGLTFEAKAGRIVAMKGFVAVASLTSTGAGQNADIMRSPAFLTAAAALASQQGMRKALASVGFKMIRVPVTSKAVVARKVQEAVQASVNQQAREMSTLTESMAIAAAGLARGRWKGKENPLLAAFAGELNALGIRNSERVVARILASSLVPYSKTLIEVATDINKLSPAARKETAAVLEMTNATSIEDDTAETTAKSELEDRFQTTAAVLRATLPVVASGSKSARQSQIVASAHQQAMSILNGDAPLMLGQ